MPTDITPASFRDARNFALRAAGWSLGLFGVLRLPSIQTLGLLPVTQAQANRGWTLRNVTIQSREARILRVELDRELKRDYQRFLQERNRGDRDSDGRPDRTIEEIQEWARERDLPYFDEQVHFPDVRIEYEDMNGDIRWEDVEVTTEHYRGGHASAAARSGFSIHAGGSSRGGAPFDPRAAEEFL